MKYKSNPRIMAKESSLEKKAAPGKTVTVSFPLKWKRRHRDTLYEQITRFSSRGENPKLRK